MNKGEAIRYRQGKFRTGGAPLVTERPLTVFYNDGEVVTLLTSGDHLDELAVGFLVSEGVLGKRSPAGAVEVDQENGRVFVTGRTELDESGGPKRAILTSGCGKGTVFYESIDRIRLGEQEIQSNLTLTADEILAWMKKLTRGELQEKTTRGTHACMLVLPGGEHMVREDVGRHNALDKIIGRTFLSKLDLSDAALFTTGRLTSEVVLKIQRIGIPAVLSRSAATDLAVDLAGQIDLTLVAYVRAGSFRVHNGSHRVTGTDSA